VRALRFGVTADHADAAGGVNLIDLEVSKGIDAFGASDADDPRFNGARPDFTRATLYVARLQSLQGEWSLLVAATAQASGDRLPTAEMFGLGGETFLRGFDPSEVIGENGAAAKVELRRNVALGALLATAYAFADTGHVRRKVIGSSDLSATLASWGGGVRFGSASGWRGYLELAKPLWRNVASQGNRDARVFAGIGVEF
jgi:hemolysin activation/secretion protein